MNEFVEVEDLGEVAPCAILLNTTSSEKDKIQYTKYKILLNTTSSEKDKIQYTKYKILLNTTSSEKRQNMDIDSIYKTCHLGEL